MKKLTKRLIAAVLVLTMLVVIVPVTDAQAATSSKTTSYTVYKGEEFTWTNYETVKSVKSSDKKIVKATKDSSANYKVDLKAKKVGKAKITVKTNYGTYYLNLTVKKLAVKVTLSKMSDGYVLVKVKNKTDQTFDGVYVDYTLVDGDGDTVASNTMTVSNCVAGKAVYDYIYYNSYSYDVDIDASTAKVSSAYHTPSYTYKNRSSKVKVTAKETTDESGNLTISLTNTNTASKPITGCNYILIYDADDNIIGLDTRSFYLASKVTDTSVGVTIYSSLYPDYDHYVIKTVAYSYTM
ncbi:MAG: hypothetical protein LUI02_06480 [Clostridiales bacterium]|nr:hypothetical protein [Clostridiales bacterium]